MVLLEELTLAAGAAGVLMVVLVALAKIMEMELTELHLAVAVAVEKGLGETDQAVMVVMDKLLLPIHLPYQHTAALPLLQT